MRENLFYFPFSPVGSPKVLLANRLGSFVKWFRLHSHELEKNMLIVRQCFDLILNMFHITLNCFDCLTVTPDHD